MGWVVKNRERYVAFVALFLALAPAASATVIQWRGVLPAASKPGFRTNHAVAWDATRHRLVVFGGRQANKMLGDTWEWDPKQGWGLVAGEDPGNSEIPLPRENAVMAFDRARSRIVLFGGRNIAGVLPGDTFEWDGSSWKRFPTGAPPMPMSGRTLHALADGNGKVVLFGGLDATSVLATPAALTWNGAGWQPLAVPASLKSRVGHSLTYDSVNDKYVLFGGQITAPAIESETWQLSGTTWTNVCGTGAAGCAGTGLPRWFHSAAFDATAGDSGSKGRVVVFGGWDAAFNTFSDTWTWDGSSWTQTAASGSVQGLGRVVGGLAYDDVDRVVVLYGGGPPNSPLRDTRSGRFMGQPCDGPSDCAADAFCSTRGNVCCNNACDGTCQTCDLPNGATPPVLDGVCRVAVGRDPGNGCATGAGCIGSCNASGKCVFSPTQQCGIGDPECVGSCGPVGQCLFPSDTGCGVHEFFCGGHCNGKGTCAYPDATTRCGPPDTDGECAGHCDGKGKCSAFPGSDTRCNKICLDCDGKGHCVQDPKEFDPRCGNHDCPGARHKAESGTIYDYEAFDASAPKRNCLGAPYFKCGWRWKECE
jgi:hypothetical protein